MTLLQTARFSKCVLALTGAIYLYLALWCTFQPEATSRRVGLAIVPGSGQSEFLTVYGGLEFGLALVFLMPFVRPGLLEASLLACLLIHGSLVAFRTIGFFRFEPIQPMTWKLAAGEWTILLLSAIAMFIDRPQHAAPPAA
jgi:hypothetical protein